jgi:hypothetical protein
MNALEFRLSVDMVTVLELEVAQVESLFYSVALFWMNKLLMLVEVLLLTTTILKDMELKN